MTTALLTDMYELTMLDAAIADGTVSRRAVFETFSRRLPAGRRFGMVGGTGRLLDLLRDFRFDEADLRFLRDHRIVSEATAAHLADFRFTGTITALPEGEVYWPHTPVLTVHGTFGEALILETVVLSVLNHDSAVASAAARMVIAAQGRPLIEMGSRRVHERAAVAAARAAYVAGFATTSNLEAGRSFGVPVAGTAAHASVLARPSEREAFAAQVAQSGPDTTILVDTYDIAEGIRTAIDVAGTGLRAIRLDSGDLLVESRKARDLLDSLGAPDTKVSVTSDLDEYLIEELQGAPIDIYGVGTRVATGSGAATAGMVYKLVAIEGADGSMRSVAKKSTSKTSTGGDKTVSRFEDGREVWTLDGTVPDGATGVHETLVDHGDFLAQDRAGTERARQRAAAAIAALPPRAAKIAHGEAFRTSEEWEQA
ncbi:nicotinate phosphoribosyltransferase [Brachybacterium huguangmaarense]|uniref:Nicotinate phosphoribosyltransferase n=1 Tax=Brachybacterium huguangmaarense TaxID=1652028 RepID=A0ABY6FYA9_9MICO|nr:nicotinate phosphoribosyltransferase [Brachybacterium huguangmaarense]UYG15921.1 nicotinate phosphoribosyltransferase [Brachybacterium huguangmaarense]